MIQIRAPLNTNKVDEEQKVAPASPSSELPRSLDSDKRPQEYFTEVCAKKLNFHALLETVVNKHFSNMLITAYINCPSRLFGY